LFPDRSTMKRIPAGPPRLACVRPQNETQAGRETSAPNRPGGSGGDAEKKEPAGAGSRGGGGAARSGPPLRFSSASGPASFGTPSAAY